MEGKQKQLFFLFPAKTDCLENVSTGKEINFSWNAGIVSVRLSNRKPFVKVQQASKSFAV